MAFLGRVWGGVAGEEHGGRNWVSKLASGLLPRGFEGLHVTLGAAVGEGELGVSQSPHWP